MTLSYIASADSHIIEPYDLWTKTIGHKYGDRVPHRHIGEVRGVPGDYVFTGAEYIKVGDLRQEGAGSTENSAAPVPTDDLPPELADKVTRSNSDPSVRLELMEFDSVNSEIIQGTNMLLAMRMEDYKLLQDCSRVFNDYCIEYCSQSPSRLLGTAMIPTHDVDWAVNELERVAKKGMRSAIINTDLPAKYEPYRSRRYDKLWAAACAHDFPLTLHLGTGKTRDPFTLITPEEKGEVPGLYLDIFDDGRRAIAQEFIFGGIFDRFEKLKMILGEYEVSWFPYYAFRLRQMQGAMGHAMGVQRVKKLVDQYIQHHVYAGFTDDAYFDRAYDVIGEDNVLWGSDYPHPRNTFPNTRKVLNRIFANVPESVKAKAAGLNMAKLFKLDVKVPAPAAVPAE
jgi:predicted TIM-barrel fold metal-dependent hydrolase